MNSISTNGIVRFVLVVNFAIASLVGAGGFYYLLHERALQRVVLNAERLLTTATAIRSYTNDHVGPALRDVPGDQFHEESVPAFAAQTIYRNVQAIYPGYTYREPALNPTNPNDRPTPFEVQLINRFRADPDLKELSGTRDDSNGEVYYLARPMKATESCLACHDTPQRAPAAMIAKYGPNNGFGWRLGETVAIQSLTVPAANELRETGEIVMILMTGLLILFVIMYFALTLSIDSFLVHPLQSLSQAADAASLKGDARIPLPRSGATELRTLATAVDRLRTSLAKALKQLSDKKA